MIVVHEDVAVYKATKPMECPKCGYRRAFDVPSGACVRRFQRGKVPPGQLTDIALLKCRKCGRKVGISVERN